MNSEIAEMLTFGAACTIKNEADLMSDDPTSFTALISGANGVFTLYTGVVEFIGSYDGIYSVSLLMNSHELFRYLYLKDVQSWDKGLTLGSQIKLGVPFKNKVFGFEYCTQWKGDSKYPVRLCGRTWYKQNPLDILEGRYKPPEEIGYTATHVNSEIEYEFNNEEMEEWEMDLTEEELGQLTMDEDSVPLSEIEVPDEDFDQPSSFIDMDKADGFDPTQYIHYIQSLEDEDSDEDPDEEDEDPDDDVIDGVANETTDEELDDEELDDAEDEGVDD